MNRPRGADFAVGTAERGGGKDGFAVGTAVMDLVCSPCEGFEFPLCYFAPPLVECLSSPGDGFRAVR